MSRGYVHLYALSQFSHYRVKLCMKFPTWTMCRVGLLTFKRKCGWQVSSSPHQKVLADLMALLETVTTREGRNKSIKLERFYEALKDPSSGLTLSA